MKSKIHPFLIIKNIILIGLCIPLFLLSINGFNRFFEAPLNIFAIIALFSGLFGASFLIFGARALRQIQISDDIISEKWLGLWEVQRIDLSTPLMLHESTSNYFIIKIKKITVQNSTKQIRFSNLDFRNFNRLKNHLTTIATPQKFDFRLPLLDKIAILLFLLLTIWMVISAILGITV